MRKLTVVFGVIRCPFLLHSCMTFRSARHVWWCALDRHKLDAMHAYRNDAPTPDPDDQSSAVAIAITA
jgi:hypothetical protein